MLISERADECKQRAGEREIEIRKVDPFPYANNCILLNVHSLHPMIHKASKETCFSWTESAWMNH